MRFLTVLLLTLSLSVALVTTQHETPESKNEKEDSAIPDEDEENFRRPEEDLKEFLVPPPEVDEKMNELPPRITEADHDRIQEILKQFPGLPKDTFTIKDTPFRKKHTPEEIEELKRKHAEKKRLANQPLFDMVKEKMAKYEKKMENLTAEEAEVIVHRLQKEQEDEIAMEQKENSHDEL